MADRLPVRFAAVVGDHATLGIRLADAEQTLDWRIDHSIVSDSRTVVYALDRGVPFSASNPETQVSRDKRLAEHLLRADVPVPAEPMNPRKRRTSLLAWRQPREWGRGGRS